MSVEVVYSNDSAVVEGGHGRLGIWLFLASEAMLFGALIAAYLALRAGAVGWPHPASYLSVPLGALNCLVLVASSVTMVLAWRELRRRDGAAFRAQLGRTNLLALVFLAVKGVEYAQKLSHDILASDRTFLVLYFTLTGLHAVHVLAGLGVNLYFAGAGARLFAVDPARLTRRIEVAGIYWHFVDLTWLVLFALLYLW